MRSQDVQEDLLGQLQRIARIAQPPQGDRVDRRLELLDQRAECLSVPSLRPPDHDRQIGPAPVLQVENTRSDQHVTHLPRFGGSPDSRPEPRGFSCRSEGDETG